MRPRPAIPNVSVASTINAPPERPRARAKVNTSVMDAIAMRDRGGPNMSTMKDASGRRLTNDEAKALMPEGGYRVSMGSFRGLRQGAVIGSAAGAAGSKGTPTSARGKFGRLMQTGYDQKMQQQGAQAGAQAARAEAGATAPAPASTTATTTAAPPSVPDRAALEKSYLDKGYAPSFAKLYANNAMASAATTARTRQRDMSEGGREFMGPVNRPSPATSDLGGLTSTMRSRPRVNWGTDWSKPKGLAAKTRVASY